MPVYCYTAECAGWSCVYRSLQNALSIAGHNVIGLNDMVTLASNRPQSKWIEPAQLLKVATVYCPTAETALLNTSPKCVDRMLFTYPHEYKTHCITVDAALEWIQDKRAVVLDNGTFGYAFDVKRSLLYDPHTTDEKKVIKNSCIEEFLRRAPLYMMLGIH